MRMTSLARRYAGALFETAKAADAIDKIQADLGSVVRLFREAPELQEVLSHPLVPPDRKKKIAAEVLGSSVQGTTIDFLSLLIDKRREALIPEVEQEYVQLANEFRQVLPVIAISAVPLTADEQDRLRAKLEGLTGKHIELESTQDPSLIGGLLVRIGDTVIDGSVRGYLAALRNRMLVKE
jgi:F-type H+-transporting ATPase subunit delta